MGPRICNAIVGTAGRRVLVVLGSLGALAAVGCQEGTATDDWEVCPLQVTVRATAPAGSQAPRISWIPDCRLNAVVFRSASDTTQLFWVASTTGNELVGPVTYGERPARATAGAPLFLAAGSYVVTLFEVVPGYPSPQSREIGRSTFTFIP
jgi:hypothetical protein